MKRISLLYVIVLALAFILSGCQGDVGPAASPGANGADGANGGTGPQGPVGQTGTTGALVADPFKVTQFHGSANAKEATRGPNNSANPWTTITAASVNADGKLMVDFKVTKDSAGTVAYTGLPASSMTFRFAQLRAGDNTGDSTYWVNYLNVSKTATIGSGFATVPVTKMNQGSGETGSTTGGTWTDNGNGTYRYVTSAAVNTTIDVSANFSDSTTVSKLPKGGVYPWKDNLGNVIPISIRVAIQMGDPDGTGSATMGANNAIYDFVPVTGTTVADPREIVVVANCNECHKTLGLHGGGSLDTKICVICHNPTQGEPNSINIIDFKVMIHKIHMGKYLPSAAVAATSATDATLKVYGTPYVIYDDGTPPSKHDYSYVNFPAYPANCTKCHKNATMSDNYKNNPNKEACGACHDGIDFSTGLGTRVVGYNQGTGGTYFASSNLSLKDHAGGIKTNADCALSCHTLSDIQAGIDTSPVGIPDSHDFAKRFATGENTAELTITKQDGITSPAFFVAGDKPQVKIVLKDSTGVVIDPTTITDTPTGTLLQLAVSGPRALRKSVLTTYALEPLFGGKTATSGAGYRNDLRIMTNKLAQDDFGKRNDVADATKVTGVIYRTDTGKILYQLDDVTNLAAGTYIAYVYYYTPTSKKMPAYKLITFQVKTATEDKKIATGCFDCHSSGTQVEAEADPNGSTVKRNFWHVSRTEHPAQFDPDYCGNCHDYRPEKDGETNNATNIAAGAGVWKQNKLGFGAMPVSKRVHSIHFAARLNHIATGDAVSSSRTAAMLPQDVRNCEKCHPKGTSTGTWQLTSTDQTDSTGLWLTAKTPMRVACSGCHDSDNAWLHMTTMTVDPTPATVTAGTGIYPFTKGPFSGDEQESCKACHAPLGLGAAGTATGTLGALQAPRLTN